MSTLLCGPYRLSLERPLLMGIVNLTPDSFSGDGVTADVKRAIEHARQQWMAGADILDIGAESSRPGAVLIPEEEEIRRLMPVLKEVSAWGVPVSVDTYKPVVMRAALDVGVTMINDIKGMTSEESLSLIAESDCAVCIMHMRGSPGTMQNAPYYEDVVAEVSEFLSSAALRCRQVGIADSRIVLDPGFGFGKTLDHNLAVFRALTAVGCHGLPLLIGVSRKSMLGAITGRSVEQRLPASIAAALIAVQKGARILRVHDVAATKDALAVWAAIEKGELP